MAVFGIGVTIIDLFGILDQLAPGGTGDAGNDGDSGDSGQVGEDATDVQVDATDAETQSGEKGSWVVSGQSSSRHATHDSAPTLGVHGTLAVAKVIGTLRTGVYFSLGAGPTGLFALLTGVGGIASLAWSAGAGVFLAVLAKALRAFVRRDLDSSIKPEEFLMDQAVISVPVSPGALGKALVSRYGRDTELYVRCKDPRRSLPKGEEVRIVDMDDDCYWVEAHD